MIRKFQSNDIDVVMQIWLEGNLKAHSFIAAKYWLDNFVLVKEMLPQEEIYVFEDATANCLQGFIGLMDNYVAGIFVVEEFRSLGVGSALLDFAKNKKESLMLKVYQRNVRARAFYEREGFETVDIGIDEATGVSEITMSWHR